MLPFPIKLKNLILSLCVSFLPQKTQNEDFVKIILTNFQTFCWYNFIQKIRKIPCIELLELMHQKNNSVPLFLQKHENKTFPNIYVNFQPSCCHKFIQRIRCINFLKNLKNLVLSSSWPKNFKTKFLLNK